MNVVSYTEEDYPQVWETQEFAVYHADAFTHWMSLPEPPLIENAPSHAQPERENSPDER